MSALRLQLFGAVRAVRDNGEPISFQGRKTVALLSYLALTNIPHRREHLAGLLWPDLPDSNARNNLRVSLSRIGRSLGSAQPPYLRADRHSVARDPDAPLWLDTEAFEDLVGASRRHSHDDRARCAECQPRLLEAAELYRGDLLAGLSLEGCEQFDEWRLARSEGYRQAALAALDDLGSFCEAAAELSRAEAHTRRLLALDPLAEGAHRRLMRLLSHQHGRNAALEHFHEYQAYLLAELGIEPEDETVALCHRIQAGTLEKPIAATLTSFVRHVANHNLPTDITPFVGREHELEQLGRFLGEQRLVTLLGIGGIGKTRLALEAARSQLGAYRDGIFLVRLAPLQSAADIPVALAEAISFRFQQGSDIEAQVLRHLAPKQLLLLLDNFEHLLDGRVFVAELLREAPGVAVLATSRQKLGITGEAVYSVSGLSYPRANQGEDPSPPGARRLFLDVARRVRLDFEPTAEDLSHIDGICRLVEGHPLALVLAASWLESLTCREIAAELHEGIDLLETDAQDVPDRQRSIRAAFDASWQRLSSEERSVYAGMAVFRGGFTRRAAREVSGASLRQLSDLLQRSLIQHLPEGRYELHELMRQFAEEKLAAAGEIERACERHGVYYLSALVAWKDDFRSGDREGALASFEADFENVRAAWRWALNRERLEPLARSVGSLRLFCTLRSLYQTLIGLLEPVEALLVEADASPEFELEVLVSLGTAYRSVRGYLVPEVKESFERAYRLTERLAGSPELFSVLYGLWSYHFVGADFERALEVVGQWRRRLASTGPQRDAYLDDAEVVVHHIEGAICYQLGEFDRARRILERGISLYRPDRHQAFIAGYGQDPAVFCRNWLAVSYWMLGLPDRALRTAEEALSLAANYRHPFTETFALFCRLQVALLRQSVDSGMRYADELLKHATENDFLYFAPLATIGRGWALTRRDREEGLTLMEQGLQAFASRVQTETFSAYLIDGLNRFGRHRQAIELADEVLLRTRATADTVFEAGLLHLKAVALSGLGRTEEAETVSLQAIDTARSQGAMMLELRATVGHCRSLTERGRAAEAAEMLTAIHGRFSEGFDTTDLREAEALLARIRSG